MGIIRQRIANFIAGTHKNAAGDTLGLRDSYFYSGSPSLNRSLADIHLSDQDLYTGYLFSSINNRANVVVELAENNLKTSASAAVVKQAKISKEEVRHPYLDLIDESDTFANSKLWYDYSTYMDLEGVYYILAVRNISRGSKTVLGDIQYFKLLNPYHIERVVNQQTLELGGYREYRNGMIRDIPPEMIIEVRRLNPFDWDKNYAMTDAAKDNQLALLTAGEFTRSAVRNNINSPGILSTGIEMPSEKFRNFRSTVLQHTKGEPLFGNGSGKVSWEPMLSDLEKAALDKVHDMNLQSIIAVGGVSKTSLGIEQSGVTRDTSKTQRDLLVANHCMPQLRMLLDAMNQDYRRYYPKDWAKTKYELFIDNPLGSDRDAELKDVEIRTSSFELYRTVKAKGYTHELSAKYAAGEVTLEELGKPTEEPEGPPLPIVQPPGNQPANQPDDDEQQTTNQKVSNAVVRSGNDRESFILEQESSLKGIVVQVQTRLVGAVMNKVQRNAYEQQSDIVNNEDKQQALNELAFGIVAFYTAVIPLEAGQVIQTRLTEFAELELKLTAMPAFEMNKQVTNYIEKAAKKASTSHIDTILDDVLEAVQKVAVEGVSRDQVVDAIRREFVGVSKQRADLIAKTETYRAHTRAQYEADKQFIKQSGLEGGWYKQVRNRSGHPCAFCKAKASEAPIPFDQPFAEVGDVLTAEVELKDGTTSVRKLPITYETIQAGGYHPRCECDYILIFKE